jgi:hypothetical protein
MENFRKWNPKKDSTGNGCQYWKWECQFQYWQIARLGTYTYTHYPALLVRILTRYGVGNNREILGEKRAKTFTNVDRGIADFRHIGVLVSRINTKVYSESVQEIFASFTVKT